MCQGQGGERSILHFLASKNEDAPLDLMVGLLFYTRLLEVRAPVQLIGGTMPLLSDI